MKRTDIPLSRREFAKRAALGSAAVIGPASLPALLNTESSAQPTYHADPFSSLATRHSPVPNQLPAEAEKLSPQSRAEAEARHQAILALYPDRFSDAQKTDLRRLSFVLQPQLDRLRSWTVVNSDQPALYLKPLVEREKKTNAPPNLKSAPSAGAKAAPAATPTKPPTTAPAEPTDKP